MSQIDKATFDNLYNNASGGFFPNNNTQEISSADVRQSMRDIKDSFVNKTDEAFSGVRGAAPGINTITQLKAIPTTSLPVITIAFRDTDSNVLRFYELVTGATVESLPGIVRPNDFVDSGKIWILAPSGDGVGPVAASAVSVDDSNFDVLTGTDAQTVLDDIDDVLNALPANTLDAVLAAGNDATAHDIINAGDIYHLPGHGPDVIPGSSDPLFGSTDPLFGETDPGLFGELGGAPNTLNVGVSAEIIRMGKTGTKLLMTSPDGTEWYFSISNAGAAVITAV